jgi:3-polyprenyl-4-hydroxybenzoate decarboxylase
LAPKLVLRLNQIGDLAVVVTERSKEFYDWRQLQWGCTMHKERKNDLTFHDDSTEWALWKKKGDPVQHIDLRKWADVMVIAPLTANTLAKMANGLCDNLLTSTVRAWDWKYKPVILAPAMNTLMLEHPLTKIHLRTLTEWGATVIPSVPKTLACGDTGDGAMANIEDIAQTVEKSQRWLFPLDVCNGVPVKNHPGAFGYRRKFDVHTGVDLYTRPGEWIKAMESGTVVGFIPFTGKKAGFPWWLETNAVLIQGKSGVICYGEIEPVQKLKVGEYIRAGRYIAKAIPVLPPEKLRSDIPGHSVCMLHVELYSELYKDKSRGIWEGWGLDKEKPEKLLDPTQKLLECKPDNLPVLSMP